MLHKYVQPYVLYLKTSYKVTLRVSPYINNYPRFCFFSKFEVNISPIFHYIVLGLVYRDCPFCSILSHIFATVNIISKVWFSHTLIKNLFEIIFFINTALKPKRLQSDGSGSLKSPETGAVWLQLQLCSHGYVSTNVAIPLGIKRKHGHSKHQPMLPKSIDFIFILISCSTKFNHNKTKH